MDVVHLEIEDPRWREALGRIRHDFYHFPEYVKLDGECNEARPKAFLARDGTRELFIPYLVRRCDHLFPDATAANKVCDVVSPYGYPGLLLSDGARESPEFARQAMQRFRETLSEQGVCSAFFRMNPLLSDGFRALFPENFFGAVSDTVAIDLSVDETQMWKNVRDGHQWTINKCRKLGFIPRIAPLHEHLDCFMEIYKETMDRVRAKDSYYFPREYFARLAEMREHVHCFVIELEGKPAAACIFFECDGIVQAHLGGTKSEYMNKSPFHLLLYHVAGWAKSRGNRYMHLGGGVGGSNDRLLQFKLGFSHLLFPFMTLRLITDEEKYRELTTLRAQAANVPVDDLLNAEYFPAYRAPLQQPVEKPV